MLKWAKMTTASCVGPRIVVVSVSVSVSVSVISDGEISVLVSVPVPVPGFVEVYDDALVLVYDGVFG